MQRTALIMAGGSGERFWPLSRQNRPKQLLNLTAPDRTMLDEALERIAPLISPGNVFIVTGERLQAPIREALAGALPPENVIAEPLKRNTAPCIALGAAFIAERYAPLPPEEISIAVLTADHFIADAERFRASVSAALSHAERTGDLATFGVVPARPATGYGYIEVNADDLSNARRSERPQALAVASFREKPDEATARRFVEQGNFFWNSGMFFWRADAVIGALREYLPEVGGVVGALQTALRGATRQTPEGAPSRTREIFEAMPDISIDYGLMERARNVACLPAEFGWDDVGSWDALERVYEPDEAGNINIGGALLLEARNCVVMNAAGAETTAVAVLGADNLAVIVTPDGVLVCPKDRAQDVRKAVAALREQSGGRFV